MKNLLLIFRYLLAPISLIYGIITYLRNKAFDKGIFTQKKFPIPVICVGNLSAGGTGKTPHTEYLINLLKAKHKIAVLSRGYGRKTKGYILGNKSHNSEILGDEPQQYQQKFGTEIKVAVCEKRVLGIEKLIQEVSPDVVVLDDAFQHRAVKAGLYIVLTPYFDLYSQDYMLPTGNLREFRSGAKRADIILISKCPENLSLEDKKEVISKIKPLGHQSVYFSWIVYSSIIYAQNGLCLTVESLMNKDILLVTGIANPKPLEDFLEGKANKIQHLEFGDHHNFSEKDIVFIQQEFQKLGEDKIILTTEKDYTRLLKSPLKDCFYIPIKVRIDQGDFDKNIEDFISQF